VRRRHPKARREADVNEDRIYDAAEREMDLYRNEITRLTEQRQRVSDTADQLRELLDKLYDALTVGGQRHGDVRRNAIGILQAAGIGYQPPAVETAGTEHLAAQLAEGRRP
jgi:hypothetical protein